MDDPSLAEIMDEAAALERRISELPAGYISRKTINGKVRFYRQWHEGGKTRSVYVRESELEETERLIAERRECASRLNLLRKRIAKAERMDSNGGFHNTVRRGADLILWAEGTEGWRRRQQSSDLDAYLRSDSERVCVLCGLRRTGKTTMIRQAIAGLDAGDQARSAYILVSERSSMAELGSDIRRLREDGVRYLFVDEVTLLSDFIGGSGLFSRILVPDGMRVVLTGTDSLSFVFAKEDALYDAVTEMRTTYIPYGEHSRLLGTDDIDVYLRSGGMLSSGQLNLEDGRIEPDGLGVGPLGSMEGYLNRSVALNIQNTLRNADAGSYLMAFQDLYQAGELTNVINRVVEDINHRFLLDVVDRDYRSANLESAAGNLREAGEDLLDDVDADAVLAALKRRLDILDRDERTVDVTQGQLGRIRRYLSDLDLIDDYVIEDSDTGRMLGTVMMQPALRYAQVTALLESLESDRAFMEAAGPRRDAVRTVVENTVLGRMLEEAVILETQRSLVGGAEVFRLRVGRREVDMVVRDRESGGCLLFEIKHGAVRNPRQYRHLTDAEVSSYVERVHGPVVGRTVLYRGEDAEEDGVRYMNVESYLKGLPVSVGGLFPGGLDPGNEATDNCRPDAFGGRRFRGSARISPVICPYYND